MWQSDEPDVDVRIGDYCHLGIYPDKEFVFHGDTARMRLDSEGWRK